MTGQEERDILFARLFGLTAVIDSGLLVRTTPLATSASTSSSASNLSAYQDVLTQLLALGEKKSWLRESAWWTIGLAIDALHASDVPWKAEAEDITFQTLYTENKFWTPEKIAITLKLQQHYPSRDWQAIMSPTFKHSRMLVTGNYGALARILKVACTAPTMLLVLTCDATGLQRRRGGRVREPKNEKWRVETTGPLRVGYAAR